MISPVIPRHLHARACRCLTYDRRRALCAEQCRVSYQGAPFVRTRYRDSGSLCRSPAVQAPVRTHEVVVYDQQAEQCRVLGLEPAYPGYPVPNLPVEALVDVVCRMPVPYADICHVDGSGYGLGVHRLCVSRLESGKAVSYQHVRPPSGRPYRRLEQPGSVVPELVFCGIVRDYELGL